MLGLIGVIHMVLARHEYRIGDIEKADTTYYSAKCWTGWAIGLGVLIIVIYFIVLGVVSDLLI